jgi:hypothetical protein
MDNTSISKCSLKIVAHLGGGWNTTVFGFLLFLDPTFSSRGLKNFHNVEVSKNRRRESRWLARFDFSGCRQITRGHNRQ